MKKGALSVILLAAAGVLFIAGNVMTAEEVEPPKDGIVIDSKGYKKKRYGPLTFDHAKHVDEYKEQCVDCHHDYQDGKNVWKEGDPVKKCDECHDPNGRSKDTPMGLRYAFHDNCNDCHEKAIKEGKKDAPKKTRCTACHKRK